MSDSRDDLNLIIDAIQQGAEDTGAGRIFRRRKEDCRCDDLRAVFGGGAPQECGPCALRRRYVELQDAGFVHISEWHRLRFQDCGVAIETTVDHQSWAPAWAILLVDLFYSTEDLQPILCRAAIDHPFAEAVATIIAQAVQDPSLKVREFAIAQGVELREK